MKDYVGDVTNMYMEGRSLERGLNGGHIPTKVVAGCLLLRVPPSYVILGVNEGCRYPLRYPRLR